MYGQQAHHFSSLDKCLMVEDTAVRLDRWSADRQTDRQTDRVASLTESATDSPSILANQLNNEDRHNNTLTQSYRLRETDRGDISG